MASGGTARATARPGRGQTGLMGGVGDALRRKTRAELSADGKKNTQFPKIEKIA